MKGNFVAKNLRTGLNKAVVMRDRKKDAKQGKSKHRVRYAA